jgi:glycosyltransferase involved in cell wall biosynthesis
VIVPYYGMDRYLEDTLRSVYGQDHARLEVIVVNDGSLRPEDQVLGKLATRYPIRVLTQENAGLGSARNSGIAHSRGRFVLPLDADNMLAPSFVRRCVEILAREPEVPFVTTWSRYVDEQGRPMEGLDAGYQPIGNSSAAVLHDNVAGDGTAVMRRSLFDRGYRYSPDLTSYEDWQLYRELHDAGLFGLVVPERLLLYRVRPGSMLREVGLQLAGRLYGEMQAELRERQVRWQSKNVSASRP